MWCHLALQLLASKCTSQFQALIADNFFFPPSIIYQFHTSTNLFRALHALPSRRRVQDTMPQPFFCDLGALLELLLIVSASVLSPAMMRMYCSSGCPFVTHCGVPVFIMRYPFFFHSLWCPHLCLVLQCSHLIIHQNLCTELLFCCIERTHVACNNLNVLALWCTMYFKSYIFMVAQYSILHCKCILHVYSTCI